MAKTALIIVDVQHDFLPPSGSLAVQDGQQILPVIDELLDERHRWDLVVASRDAHPQGHISFVTSHPGHKVFESLQVTNTKGKQWEQTLWPEHCIQQTHGYELHPEIEKALNRRKDAGLRTVIVEKGTNKEIEAYSAFDGLAQGFNETLEETLEQAGIKRCVVVGLATDYCVRASALSAIKAGFKTVLLAAGARAVGGREAANKTHTEIRGAGGSVIENADWQSALASWMQ